MIEIRTDAQPPEVISLWEELRKLASALPPGWVLVGGLMVQLHIIESGTGTIRLTTDIDLLGRARDPKALPALAQALKDLQFQLGDPDLDGYSHRFERDGLVVDLLAPDGLNRPASIGGNTNTVGIPGGSQALTRAEAVQVRTAGGDFTLLRPSLLGAILIKARSLLVHHDPDAQLVDLVALLALVGEPAVLATGLKTSERKWLRAVKTRVFEAHAELLDAEALDAAQLTLAVLAPD